MRRTAFIMIVFAIGVSISITGYNKKFLAKKEQAPVLPESDGEDTCQTERCIPKATLVKFVIDIEGEGQKKKFIRGLKRLSKGDDGSESSGGDGEDIGDDGSESSGGDQEDIGAEVEKAFEGQPDCVPISAIYMIASSQDEDGDGSDEAKKLLKRFSSTRSYIGEGEGERNPCALDLDECLPPKKLIETLTDAGIDEDTLESFAQNKLKELILFKTKQGEKVCVTLIDVFDALSQEDSGAFDDSSEEGGEPNCECFANGSEFEGECEGKGFTVDECTANANCQWGPGEIQACVDQVTRL